MDTDSELTRVGLELLAEAQETELTAGELVARLFPFIEEASRRMSTRAISLWLKEKHGILISQPTISRALRSPERYRESFAEYIEPYARIASDAAGAPIDDLLYPEPAEFALDIFNDYLKIPSVRGDTKEECQMAYEEVRNAMSFLEHNWFKLPSALRGEFRKYLVPREDQEGEEQK